MENLNKYKSHIKDVQEIIEKLENGTLGLDELIKLEELTRNLHERSVILKYKAFEKQVMPKTSDEVLDEGGAEEEVPEVEEEVEEMDFSMFEEGPVEEMDEEMPEVVVEEMEELEEEMHQEHESEIIEEPAAEENNQSEKAPAQDMEFWERIQSEDHSLSSQFEGSKLDTLVGAFSLNEKLRFINELFDGSSELFSEAVKTLDAFDSIDQASGRFNELATEHDWDPEDEAVVEFMTYVRRRYA